MRKIVEYTVLTGWYLDMPEIVKGYMNKGWQPLGGITAYMNSAYETFCMQAMVKYEETDSDKDSPTSN